MDKQWFVIYTKPHTERRVSEILSRKNIENYMPLNRIVGDWRVGKKIMDEPLFANYVFVYIANTQFSILKKIPGVVNLVYWLEKPVIVDSLEISIMKNFLNDHINVTVEKTFLGDNVPMKFDNSMRELEDYHTTIKSNKVNVVVRSLGYIMTAEVETSNVRIILSNNLSRRSKSMSAKLFNPVHGFSNFFRN